MRCMQGGGHAGCQLLQSRQEGRPAAVCASKLCLDCLPLAAVKARPVLPGAGTRARTSKALPATYCCCCSIIFDMSTLDGTPPPMGMPCICHMPSMFCMAAAWAATAAGFGLVAAAPASMASAASLLLFTTPSPVDAAFFLEAAVRAGRFRLGRPLSLPLLSSSSESLPSSSSVSSCRCTGGKRSKGAAGQGERVAICAELARSASARGHRRARLQGVLGPASAPHLSAALALSLELALGGQPVA